MACWKFLRHISQLLGANFFLQNNRTISWLRLLKGLGSTRVHLFVGAKSAQRRRWHVHLSSANSQYHSSTPLSTRLSTSQRFHTVGNSAGGAYARAAVTRHAFSKQETGFAELKSRTRPQFQSDATMEMCPCVIRAYGIASEKPIVHAQCRISRSCSPSKGIMQDPSRLNRKAI